MKPYRNLITLGAVLLAATGWALATDTGTLVVKTVDAKGSPFPGVVVEVKNTKGLVPPPPKQTDPLGTATFVVPAGAGYVVTVSLSGFNTVETADIKMELGRTKTILYTMQEMRTEHVVVKGGKTVDLDDQEGKVTFTDQFVEDLPVFGHAYQNVLTLAPGVNDADGDGNPNVHGSRSRDFKMSVDGVSNVDPLTGNFMSNVNPDAIEEIEVVTTGAGAEYGRASGGFGKIITKQGGNTFETVTGAYLRSYLFDGGSTQTEGQDKVNYHDVRASLNITGPVIKDKLFFALFHEYQDQGVPVSFQTGGGLVVQTKGSTNLDKLTWQTSPKNKLIFQAGADPNRTGPAGVDNLTDPRSGYDFKLGGPTYQVRWNAQVSSILNVESSLALSHTGVSVIPQFDGIKNSCVVDGLPSGRSTPFGRAGGSPIDEDYCFEGRTSRTSGSFYVARNDDRIRYSATSEASYLMENFLGISHNLKAGFIGEKERYSDSLIVRSFSFFEEVTPTFAGDYITTGGGTLTRTNYDPFFPDTLHRKADGTTFGMYFVDQFRPRSNFSVTLGLRLEKETIRSPGFTHIDPKAESEAYDARYNSCVAQGGSNPNRDACAKASFRLFHKYERWPTSGTNPLESIATNASTGLRPREQENFRIANTNVAPRLSLSWDPSGDQKTKFFATAGRYYDKIFLLTAVLEQGPATFSYQYGVEPKLIDCVINNQGNQVCTKVRVVEQSDNQANVAPASIYQLDRNLRTPYADEYTAGFTREIAPETSLSFTWIRKHSRDQLQRIDVNHYGQDLGTVSTQGCHLVGVNQVPVDTRKDGIFDDCGGRIIPLPREPGQGPGTPRPITETADKVPDLYLYNPFFNTILQVGNYNKSEYKAYELELVRRLHRNWQLEGSYVWSKAVGAAEDFISGQGNDPTLVQDEFGYLFFDQRHFVKVNVTTQLPLWNVRLGTAFSWASGQPYSITEEHDSRDQIRAFGTSGVAYDSVRTVYPSGQRNDRRNVSYWIFNVNAKKDFTIGKANVETSIEIFNLLNNQFLATERIRNGAVVGNLHIGRQFQLGAKFSF